MQFVFLILIGFFSLVHLHFKVFYAILSILIFKEIILTKGFFMSKLNKLLNKDTYIIILSILMLTSVSFFTFSMDSPAAFDSYSDEVMVANIMHDNYVMSKSSSEKLLLQIAPGAPHGVTPAYETENFAGIEFSNYTSQIGFHGIVYSFFESISPFSPSVSLNLFWLFNSFLLAVILVIIFKQLDKLLNYNYWVILILFSAALFSDLMLYGSNLYWIGWSLFMPFCVSLCFVNSKHMNNKNLYPKVFFITFIPALIKLLFYYEFVSSVFISLMLPFIFKAIIDKKENIKKNITVFIIGSLGALSAFMTALMVHAFQISFAYGSTDSFFSLMLRNFQSRIAGDEHFTHSIIDVFMRMLTQEVFNVFNLSFLYIHIIIICILNCLFCFFSTKTKNNKKIINLSIFTIISFLSPLSWYILAAPHTYNHYGQCLILMFLPTLFLITIQTIEVFKIFDMKSLIFNKSKV